MADAAPPKVKKLPFKPTALRKGAYTKTKPATPDSTSKGGNDDDGDDDGLALFRRSKEMAPALAAERERRMRRKKQKEEERQRRVSTEKRRRLSGDHDDDDKNVPHGQLSELGDSSAATSFPTHESTTVAADSFNSDLVTPPPSKRTRRDSSTIIKSRPITPIGPSQSSPSARRLLRSRSRHSTPRKSPPASAQFTPSKAAPIILLDDSDPEEGDVTLLGAATPSAKSRSGSIEIVDGAPQKLPRTPEAQTQTQQQMEEEDEFAEYIRKAEQEKRNLTSSFGASGGQGGGSQATAAVTAAVTILVTSNIEGTRDCGIKVYIDKPLHQVRAAWVLTQRKNGVVLPVDPSELVLTWRGVKVYNYSSLHSLGLRPYGDGAVVADGSNKRGISRDGTQVHMEIWTPDVFQRWEEEEDRRQKILAGELPDDEDAAGAEEPEPERTLKVILRARDLEVKLTVRPATTVETLITGFRTQRALGPDKEVTLWFDGGMMEEHVTMEEADIEEMDVIEVHIK
ncbi:hypothetical protein ACRE_086740 [Hapsidospora chrysogenum ATCC 11550]|uniref:Ubiquitin-like domain-containing protein n=1 Tax=Hapsidospora chrysogenum (strain ATCC 11550 / CBS 779.69 / DSM 880 / IAM 14645 / JCM 23072 / IMI 49137) TaxID=857340 RepID=A0A086SU49_HAPC1|nr:hypothetical protein ACRE_086740 [Hapsidospora chrysogenum ATCC 11550]